MEMMMEALKQLWEAGFKNLKAPIQLRYQITCVSGYY